MGRELVRSTQGRRDLNPQPSVLETDALPIAPLPYGTVIAPLGDLQNVTL